MMYIDETTFATAILKEIILPSSVITVVNAAEMKTQNKFIKTISKVIQCVPLSLFTAAFLPDKLRWPLYRWLGGTLYLRNSKKRMENQNGSNLRYLNKLGE